MPYRMKTVEKLTGIPKSTLIAWERRYGLVVPGRTESGYRVFDDEDVERLRRLKSLVDGGYRISEAIALVQRGPSQAPAVRPLEAEVAEDTRGPEAVLRGLDRALSTPREPIVEVRDALVEALLRYDRDAADRAALQLLTVPYDVRVERVFLPLLREVGDRWEAGTITVVQEHFASGYCREHLLTILRAVQTARPDAPEAICATPEGERHEFGLMGVAIKLAGQGFRVMWLGPDVPTDQLVEVVRARRPALVCISAVRERTPDEMMAFASYLSSSVPRQTRVLIGGRATAGLRGRTGGHVLIGADLADLDPHSMLDNP